MFFIIGIVGAGCIVTGFALRPGFTRQFFLTCGTCLIATAIGASLISSALAQPVAREIVDLETSTLLLDGKPMPTTVARNPWNAIGATQEELNQVTAAGKRHELRARWIEAFARTGALSSGQRNQLIARSVTTLNYEVTTILGSERAEIAGRISIPWMQEIARRMGTGSHAGD